jgi:hypothetical protein
MLEIPANQIINFINGRTSNVSAIIHTSVSYSAGKCEVRYFLNKKLDELNLSNPRIVRQWLIII